MRAVLVVELELPDDEPWALSDAMLLLGPMSHTVGRYAAIREDADRVLAVFDAPTSQSSQGRGGP